MGEVTHPPVRDQKQPHRGHAQKIDKETLGVKEVKEEPYVLVSHQAECLWSQIFKAIIIVLLALGLSYLWPADVGRGCIGCKAGKL